MTDDLDEQLKDYSARWRANLPDAAEPEFPSGDRPSPGRRRDLVWLAAAVVVAVAVGVTVWATRLLDDSGDTMPPIGPVQTVPWAPLDPTHPQFDAEAEDRYSTVAATGDLDLESRPGSTVTFEVTLTSERDLSLSPCPDFTISQSSAGTTRAWRVTG